MNLTLTFLLVAARSVDVCHLMLVDIQVVVMRLMTVIQVLHVNSWLQFHADHWCDLPAEIFWRFSEQFSGVWEKILWEILKGDFLGVSNILSKLFIDLEWKKMRFKVFGNCFQSSFKVWIKSYRKNLILWRSNYMKLLGFIASPKMTQSTERIRFYFLNIAKIRFAIFFSVSTNRSNLIFCWKLNAKNRVKLYGRVRQQKAKMKSWGRGEKIVHFLMLWGGFDVQEFYSFLWKVLEN